VSQISALRRLKSLKQGHSKRLFLVSQKRISLSLCKMKSTPAMSKQSDGYHDYFDYFVTRGANRSIRKLCVLGGLKYVFEGSAPYTTYTDWP